jgi:hypothetical protein
MISKLVCTKAAVLVAAVLFAFASFATTLSPASSRVTITSPTSITPGELPMCNPETHECPQQ